MEVAFGRGGRPRPCREDKHVRTGYGLMGHEKRIVEAFDTNGIERILLVDDVYDPPALLADELGPLLDFLESVGGQAACGEAGLAPQGLAAARSAERRGGEGCVSAWRSLWSTYLYNNKKHNK